MPKEKDIKIDKSSISNASSYEEIGGFWDKNSLDTFWSETEEVTFQINLNPNDKLTYYGINENISEQLSSIAKQKGISAKELLNSIKFNNDRINQIIVERSLYTKYS